MGATAILAEFAAETTVQRVPAEARAAALRQVIDCTGVALAASVEEAGQIITSVTRKMGGTPDGRLIGSGIPTSSIQAAWANGGLCHLLDFDDTGFSHPTACILPAAYAASERVQASGLEFLTAMVIGYEVFERLSVSARPYERKLRGRGYHPTSLYGAPAAAAAAGSLLGLDAGQMAIALGLAAASTSGLTQHFGTWGKGVQAGTAARAAMTSVLLAEEGYWANEEVFEGQFGFYNAIHGAGNYDLSHIGDELGETWAICDPGLSIKGYPSCGSTLRPIEAALTLLRKHEITYDQIERVEAHVHPTILYSLRHRKPEKGFEGKFSVDYPVAAAVLDGKVDLDTYTDAMSSRPEFREAVARVDIVEHPEWPETDYRRQPVTIILKDGRELTEMVQHPRGSQKNPMTRDERLAKYRMCASRAFSAEQVERSIAVLEGIEDVEDMRDVVTALISESVVVA